MNITGTGVALVTPFSDGEIDELALRNIVDHVTGGKVDYLVVLGSTGEASLLSNEEKRFVLDIVIDQNNGRLPIVAGNFGLSNTHELVEYVRHFDFTDISGILSASPSYVKPTQQGIIEHYNALNEVSPVPIIVYNVPGRTSSNILPETLKKIAQLSNVIGVKEASADMIQGTLMLMDSSDGFQVTSGDDTTALPLVACGASGVISVIGNVYPYEFSSLINAALANDYDKARQLNNLLYPLHKWLYMDGNPAGIKSALEIKGLCTGEVRLPLQRVSQTTYEAIKAAMKHIETA